MIESCFSSIVTLLIPFIFQVLNKTGEFTADIVEASLSSISKIVNKTFAFSNENKVAHNDIIQSVDIMLTISEKVVDFTNQDAANKTTQVRLVVFIVFMLLFLNSHYECAIKKKLSFRKYEKKQAFVGIVSDILDSGKNRLKSRNANNEKEVI